jgi:hypothetical protein
MARTGRFSFGGRSGTAEWSFDGSSFVVSPEDGGPLSFAVKEITGVSGDGYTVRVGLEGAAAPLEFTMLGHDGPTLLESLRREWTKARAEVLRLGGSGEGWPTSGQVDGLDGRGAPGAAPEPFNALMFEDVLVVAREGRDLDPLFLALVEKVAFDEATYMVQMDEWPERSVVFSKLAKETDEFLRRLADNRALLAQEAAATLAASVPSIPAGPRGVLAGTWMPGRLLDISRMDALCPGFEQAFRGEWLPSLLRNEEGAYLLEWATAGSTWLGCTREAGAAGTAGEGEADGDGAASEGEAGAGDAAENDPVPGKPAADKTAKPMPAEGNTVTKPLWMLAGKKGTWFLEALSIKDRATYCFAGGDEMPALVSRLLCAPQFSKEALYNPLNELTGDNADLAIPARSLGFLVELRKRFRQRVIHQSAEGWKKEIDKLGR